MLTIVLTILFTHDPSIFPTPSKGSHQLMFHVFQLCPEKLLLSNRYRWQVPTIYKAYIKPM